MGINSLSTSGELLAQLDTIFGNILSKEELRAQFSATKQEEHENVVSWGCRLNQLLREIMDQGPFNVAEGTEMLRYHFWNGLKDEDLRNSIRYRYDNGQTYEQLFKAARTVELEHQQRIKTSFKSKHTNVHQVSSNEQILSKLDKISDSMSAFDKRISDIEKLVTSSAVGYKQPQKQQQKRPIKRDMKLECERCHRKGHTIENCVAKRDASGKHLNGEPIEMVGTSNEINLEVEGIKTCGLLDTGSQVTTVAQWFVREKLPKFEVESVENFLKLTSASGNNIGFIGVVDLNLKFSFGLTEGIYPTPVVVLNDTDYNQRVPFIIGTNILNSCFETLKKECGKVRN